MIGGQELFFEVCVLGTRGAGKTAFLSALHNQLSVLDSKGDNFYVELDSAADANLLRKIYGQISNPDVDWPPGTATMKEFEFRCLHTDGNGKTVPLFRFLYRDYPGGILEDDCDQRSDDIREATRSAHALIVLIDGQKVLQSLEGQTPKGASLDDDLNTLIPHLNRCANRPVQFLLTKWDILHEHYSLQAVRDELLKNHNFAKFVEQRAKPKPNANFKLPVHLIPVSAVGMTFARFDKQEMRMKKVRGGRCKPFNVELAIGMTIIDQVQLRSVHKTRNLGRLLIWITKAMGVGLDVVLSSIEMSQYLIKLPSFVQVDRICDILKEASTKIRVDEDWLRSMIEAEAGNIRDQTSAVQSVMNIQALRRAAFEKNFPESQLVVLGEA